MEINGNINTANVFLVATASLSFILWIVWVIRLAFCRRKLRNKNKLLLKRLDEIQIEKRKVSAYEDLIDSNREMQMDDETAFADKQRTFRKLENLVRQSRIYRNQSVSKDELAEMVRLDRKQFEAFFKEVSPVTQIAEWMDGFRLSEALTALKEMRADEKSKKKDRCDDASVQGPTDPDKERENRIAEIASKSGFNGRKHIDKSCRRIIGMSLHELLRIL